MSIFLSLAGAVFLILFLLPLFEDVFNFGTVCGVGGSVLLILFGAIYNKISAPAQTALCAVLLVCLIILLLFIIPIIIAGRSRPKPCDTIIVLGCRVKGDRPSLALVKRVESAYAYLTENEQCIAILSGGQGKDENISEAECMKNMLTQRGISPERLLLENRSTSTDENIAFSLEIIEKIGAKKEVAVATSEYHQLRSRLICKRYGITSCPVSSKTKLSLLPTFVLREVFGVVREMMRF